MMRNNNPGHFRKTTLCTAMAAALTSGIHTSSNADIYVWTAANSGDVLFTMLDPAGAALENSSKPNGKTGNNYQTPTSGTFTYDTNAGATPTGSATIASFDFFSGTSPAVAAGITTSGVVGNANLMYANMLFNWNGNNGIPVSLVWDIEGIVSEMDGTPTSFTITDDGLGAGNGAGNLSISGATAFTTGGTNRPASDGTYTGAAFGYLDQGPQPIVTTSFNTTNVDLGNGYECEQGTDSDFSTNTGGLASDNFTPADPGDPAYSGGCMGISPSANVSAAPTTDNTANANDFNIDTSTPPSDLQNEGIGGSPMQDGPFASNNANFMFKSLVLTSFTDETAPTITLDAHVSPAETNPVNIVQGGTYTEPGATCTDAAPVGTVKAATVGGDTVLTGTIGTYTVTYDCTDSSGNSASQVTRTVNILDPGAPVITLTEGPTLTYECQATYTDPGASCDDPQDGPITPTITADNVDPTTVASGYVVTWSCTDSAPNTTTQDRTVNVVDTTAPVITPNGANPLELESNTAQVPAIFVDPGASVTDSCDSGITSPISASSGLPANLNVADTETVKSYTLTYSATDANSQTGNATLTVNVSRAQPVVSLSGSGTISLNVGDSYTESGVTINDLQDGNVTTPMTSAGTDSTTGITLAITSDVDTNTAGNYTVTYTATDSDSNVSTTVTRDVTVIDTATTYSNQSSNFSMLDASGNLFGGTNDVSVIWDRTEYTSESEATTPNMTIVTTGPTPFNAAVWEAHTIRVFGPGSYSFDSGCTTAEVLATGCPAGSAAATGDPISMTVPADHIGVHMLFDWNGNLNIDVVNVWQRDAMWSNPDGSTTTKNDLWTGIGYADGGAAPDAAGNWDFVSIDLNGDGVNGSPMVDGPFANFYANFNAGPRGTVTGCVEPQVLNEATGICEVVYGVTQDPTTGEPVYTGPSIRDFYNQNDTAESSDEHDATSLGAASLNLFSLLAMIPLMGWLRRRKH